VQDFAGRRRRLEGRMAEQGVDLLFVPPSGDLEYLTGMERRVPTFGNISYTHGWVGGAFFRPGHDPLLMLPA
jgi:Creatinase/Prolidase N-terminal domain